VLAKETTHLGLRAQSRFGVRREGAACEVERRLVANAMKNVGKRLARSLVVERPGRRDDTDPVATRENLGASDPRRVIAIEMLVYSYRDSVAERPSDLEEPIGGSLLERRETRNEPRVGGHEQRQPGAPLGHLLEVNGCRSLLVLGVSEGEEMTEVLVSERALDEDDDALRPDTIESDTLWTNTIRTDLTQLRRPRIVGSLLRGSASDVVHGLVGIGHLSFERELCGDDRA
jgi:hypothetical protein